MQPVFIITNQRPPLSPASLSSNLISYHGSCLITLLYCGLGPAHRPAVGSGTLNQGQREAEYPFLRQPVRRPTNVTVVAFVVESDGNWPGHAGLGWAQVSGRIGLTLCFTLV